MPPYIKNFLIGFSATAILLSAQWARAQSAHTNESNRPGGSIIAGVAVLPEYEGADDLQVMPLTGGEITWGERYLALEGTTLRANVLNSATVEIGPAANLTFGRDDGIKSNPVRALGVIEDAYEIGGFAAIKTRSLLTDDDELKLRIQAMRDLSDVHNGWVGDATLTYSLPIGQRFALVSAVSVGFADDKYAARYFGIELPGSVASGLPAFTAEGGVKDVGISLTASYALDQKWSIVGYGGYRRLVGDFADSPVVYAAGNADQFSAGLGLAFRF